MMWKGMWRRAARWALIAAGGLPGLVQAGAPAFPGAAEVTPHMVRYTVEDSFEFTRDLVIQALADRGLKVNNVSHIGDMLERTGVDIGATRKIYLHAEAIEFCSATVSRRMMEASPHNIVFCPYIIYVYELPQKPGTIHVAFRRPAPVPDAASAAPLAAVESLVDGLIRDALGL